MAHLKGTLHQEPCVKSEDFLVGETPIFGKMPIFSENLRPISCEKAFTQVSAWP